MHHLRISKIRIRKMSLGSQTNFNLTLRFKVLELLVDELEVWAREVDLRKAGTRASTGITRLRVVVR